MYFMDYEGAEGQSRPFGAAIAIPVAAGISVAAVLEAIAFVVSAIAAAYLLIQAYEAAKARGFGVALLPAALFQDEVGQRRLVRPFKIEVSLGDYWITSLHSRRPSPAMLSFKNWLLETIAAKNGSPSKQAEA